MKRVLTVFFYNNLAVRLQNAYHTLKTHPVTRTLANQLQRKKP